ncbi:MAG: hypothetical protein JOZ69_06575 [Myxococcales bacterium]|nr:hypothetical protein [Myxococcales bacterium]
MTLAIAAWMRFVTAGVTDGGRPLRLDDPLCGVIEAIGASADDSRTTVLGLLGLEQTFGADLTEHAEVIDMLTEWLDALASDGVRNTLRRALAESYV